MSSRLIATRKLGLVRLGLLMGDMLAVTSAGYRGMVNAVDHFVGNYMRVVSCFNEAVCAWPSRSLRMRAISDAMDDGCYALAFPAVAWRCGAGRS